MKYTKEQLRPALLASTNQVHQNALELVLIGEISRPLAATEIPADGILDERMFEENYFQLLLEDENRFQEELDEILFDY